MRRVTLLIFALVILSCSFFGSYVIKPDDVISISVFNQPELSVESKVGPDGFISVPPVGSLKVSDKTVEQIGSEITKMYEDKKIFAAIPSITVSVIEYSPYKYYALGELVNPGLVVSSESQITISQLIGLASGLKETANLYSAFIIRSNGDREAMDLSLLIENGEGAFKEIYPGDTLYVPDGKKDWIKVIGEFQNPGLVKYTTGIKLTQLVAQAGGLKETANGEEIIILTESDSTRHIYNLNDILKGKTENPELCAGCTIYVESKYEKGITILGEVNNSGVFYKEELSLLSLIGEAGGLKDSAANKITIIDYENSLTEEVNIEEVYSGKIKDPSVFIGQTVLVPSDDERFAYIMGEVKNPGIKYFIKDEKMTLGVLLSKGGGLTNISGNIYLETDGDKKILSKSSDIDLNVQIPQGAIINVEKVVNQYVYVIADNKSNLLEYQPGDMITLRKVLSALNLLNLNQKGIVTVINPEGKKSYISIEELKTRDYTIENESVVQYPVELTKISVLGSVKSSGIQEFQIGETPYLTTVIARAGGTVGSADLENVQIINGQEKYEFNVDMILKGISIDPVLDNNTIVYIPELPERYVYLIGAENGGKIVFNDDESLTLLNLLAKANLGINSDESVEITLPAGNSYKIKLSDIKRNNVDLEIGSVIKYPEIKTEIIVLGAVKNPGLFTFDIGDNLSLIKILSAAGGIIEGEADVSDIKVSNSSGKTNEFDLNDIQNGTLKDPKIEDGSFVQIPYFEKIKVNVLGGVNNPGIINFEIDEEPNLINAVSKAGGLKNESTTDIKIINTDSQISWERLLNGENIDLKNGDTVYVPDFSDIYSYIYVVGEVKNPGRVDFMYDESVNVLNSVNKTGGLLQTASDKVQVIYPNGNVVSVDMNDVRNGKDTVIPNGSTIVVNEDVKNVTVMGEVKNPGTYMFYVKDAATVYNAIAKAGGLKDSSGAETVVVQNENERTVIGVDAIYNSSIELENNSYIYVVTPSVIKVTVLGEVNNPGVIEIKENENTLGNVIAMAGSYKDVASELSIYSNKGVLKNQITPEELLRYININLVNGDTVFAGSPGDEFISILGDVNKPGIYNINDYGSSMTLDKVLAIAGGLKNQLTTGNIIIKSGEEETVFTATPENLDQLSDIKVKPGSYIFVPTRELQRVYVFGEVGSPGVVQYTDRMTVLEAILEAGGPTPDAETASIMVFENSINADPLTINLKGSDGIKESGNLKIVPGQIVYVPQSALVNVKDVMTIIASAMGLISSVISLAK